MQDLRIVEMKILIDIDQPVDVIERRCLDRQELVAMQGPALLDRLHPLTRRLDVPLLREHQHVTQ